MSESFLGEIRMFAGNFAPRGWAFCNGQILSIADNSALFALLGTTYGGDGQNTFALPDLRGRAPLHQGQGPGLPDVILGEQGGEENVTLQTNQLPAHTHQMNVVGGSGDQASPTNHLLATAPTGLGNVYGSNTDTLISAKAITPTGGSQPHDNLQPFLTINFIIALEGIFPSRN